LHFELNILGGFLVSKHRKKRSRDYSSILAPIQDNIEDIYGVALIAAALFLTVSIFSKATGIVGNYANLSLQYLVGVGRYVLPLFFLLWGASFLLRKPHFNSFSVGMGLSVCFLSFISMAYLRSPELSFLIPAARGYGGIFGGALGYLLQTLLGEVGAYILLSATLIIGGVIVSSVSLADLFVSIFGAGRAVAGRIKIPRIEKKARLAEEMAPGEQEAEALMEESEEESKEAAAAEPSPKIVSKLEKPARVNVEVEEVESEEEYQLPPLELLRTTSPSSVSFSKKSTGESIKILEQTLENFEVNASVTRVVRGPTVTRFEIQLASGVKVNRLLSLADDIALALATPDVRILTPVPGKSVVGIEVPNKQKELVTLGDILRTEQAKKADDPLTMAIGKDISGQPILADLGEMPHLLIAGATGSGKSVCLNSILTSLLMRVRPSRLKLILIDPKRIELNLFNHIPHLITPVVTDIKKAATVLGWAVREMEDRFEQLAQVGARNIDSYNSILRSKKGKDFPDLSFLPYIVVIIDELADLMMVSAAEVEDAVCRLAQLARAVGVHLIIATQRPSVDVITGLIKANITSRIAFEVSSQMDSRVILDTPGADKLVGKGDMLFLTPGASRPKRIQGALVTEHEIEAVMDFIKKQLKPEYRPEVLEDPKSKLGASGFHDELLDQAMNLVVTTQLASISMLQRRLRVGYSRAARLIDMLEEKGIVGGFEGSKPRTVLMTLEDMDRMKKMAEMRE
jgi:S-DNA-T family DNA segregation ATPase FtsK/SpoIIIE